MGKKIYYVCKYTPIELLKGFDLVPVRLDPEPASFECAESCAHPNLCGYGKAVLEEVISNEIRSLILVDCCDVCRRIFDVLKHRGDMDFLFLLSLPHKNGLPEQKLLTNELIRLSDDLLKYAGHSFDCSTAMNAWKEAPEEAVRKNVTEPHIRLTGAHGGGLLLGAIRKRSPIPVIDDTCSGNRNLSMPKENISSRNFFLAYAEALLKQDRPCMRMQFRDDKDDPGALGIVCHTVKFCDYYGFQYRGLSMRENAPLLKIETDGATQSRGQLKTRLDAFIETIHPGGIKTNGNETIIRYAAGVDSGSSSTDAVILDSNGHILGSAVLPTGAGAAHGAERALNAALDRAGLSRDELDSIVTTGYGRESIGVNGASVTEITCHAKGAHFLYPSARTVIDIGGQDSKVIRLDEMGNVENFIMNDKCAAGTGRFLEMMARTLEMDLTEMSERGLHWKNNIAISNMCTVFAESEVVSLIAENTAPEDIIHGLNIAVASKTAALVRRLEGKPYYIMTGGVAQNQGVVRALEEKLGDKIVVTPEAQLCGALGAALIALNSKG